MFDAMEEDADEVRSRLLQMKEKEQKVKQQTSFNEMVKKKEEMLKSGNFESKVDLSTSFHEEDIYFPVYLQVIGTIQFKHMGAIARHLLVVRVHCGSA